MNSTILSLIPKVPNPTTATKFIFVAYCNVIYKRLRDYLEMLKKANQTAFIKGRSIAVNFLLAHELVKNYQRSKGSRRCAIKADFRKAFDLVDWNLY